MNPHHINRMPWQPYRYITDGGTALLTGRDASERLAASQTTYVLLRPAIHRRPVHLER